jgi:hypothetical protein
MLVGKPPPRLGMLFRQALLTAEVMDDSDEV